MKAKEKKKQIEKYVIYIYIYNFTLHFQLFKLAKRTFQVITQQVKRKYKKKQNDYKLLILHL